MSGWTAGYVADVEYLASVNREQGPAHLALASAIAGVAPGPHEPGYRYLELGCGQGLTLNLLAASDPGGRFVGVDFMPAHTVQARAFAQAAGLDNVEFHEAGFEDLVAAGAPWLEPFDVVALHGVYSWVSPENRRAIVTLLKRHVKPGGMVYVTYNAMPGWGAGQTLQHLLINLASVESGRSDRRIEAAIRFALEMQKAGAITPEANVILDDVRERLERGEVRYLAHEYLNRYWNALYFTEVADAFAEAKLSFAGSASLLDNFHDLELTPAQRQLVATAPPEFKETIYDYCRNQRFRRDVFIRGRRGLNDQQRDEILRRCRLVLTVRREDAAINMKSPVGEIAFAPRTYQPIFDALAAAPHTIGELLDLPALKEAKSTARPVELAGVLVASGLAALVKDERTDPVRLARFNEAVARLIVADVNPRSGVLASPMLYAGISYSPLEIVMHAEIARAPRADAEAIANAVQARLATFGSNVRREGKPIGDEPAEQAKFVEEIGALMDRRVPVWRKLGLL